jgi:hypothetical protein
MKRLVLGLVFVLMAGSLLAANPIQWCYEPRYEHPRCYCMRSFETPYSLTYEVCVEHNPCWDCQGPGWCETSVSCNFGFQSVGTRDIRRELGKERDSIAILDFLVEFEKMTEKERSSFIAEVDEKVGDGLTECEIEARHDAYRAKFAKLMGVALQPGFIPMSPSRAKEQRQNQPQQITASGY